MQGGHATENRAETGAEGVLVQLHSRSVEKVDRLLPPVQRAFWLERFEIRCGARRRGVVLNAVRVNEVASEREPGEVSVDPAELLTTDFRFFLPRQSINPAN